MNETTHKTDPETGRAVQIVSPARLREVLDAEDSNYDRPPEFGPDDEWDVSD